MFTREVGDAKATTDIQPLDRRRGVIGQFQCQGKGVCLGLDDGVRSQVLRATENVEPLEGEIELPKPLQHGGNLFSINAERFRAAGHLHAGGFQFKVGVNSHRDIGPVPGLVADGRQPFHFPGGFKIDNNARRCRRFQFGIAFARSGKADIAWAGARIQCHAKFFQGRHIKSVSQSRQVLNNGGHRVGFDGVV